MKNLVKILTAVLISVSAMMGQIQLKNIDLEKTYIIFTQDGAEFVGKIRSHDTREIIVATEHLGEIAVPTYQLKNLREADDSDISASGEYIRDNALATRHFITTNGLDLKKGDAYLLLNWYGPDLQYGVTDNISVGFMTTWFGTPMVGSVKYSTQLKENVHLGVGALVGTMGWASLNTGGALPYASLTFGDRKTNVTFSGGYGAVWTDFGESASYGGDALMSLAGMARINNSFSFVFDSFIVPGFSQENDFVALGIPGVRFQRKENFAIQFGLTGVFDGEIVPFAIPVLQFYWKFH